MDPIDNGGFAFPQPNEYEQGTLVNPGDPGMTLRDYFAGRALVAVYGHGGWDNLQEIAEEAYEIADAMIEARKDADTSL